MKSSMLLAVSPMVLSALLTVPTRAQDGSWKARPDDRPFALVYDAQPVSYNGSGEGDHATLRRYAEAHPGKYLVFERGGSLYRLDNAASVAEAERQYALLQPLEAQQHVLSDEQKPLQQKMTELSRRMRAASTAADQTALGAEMGRLGEKMGQIGQEQGRVGTQMGAIATAFYRSAQAMFAKCLADGSCRRA